MPSRVMLKWDADKAQNSTTALIKNAANLAGTCAGLQSKLISQRFFLDLAHGVAR